MFRKDSTSGPRQSSGFRGAPARTSGGPSRSASAQVDSVDLKEDLDSEADLPEAVSVDLDAHLVAEADVEDKEDSEADHEVDLPVASMITQNL